MVEEARAYRCSFCGSTFLDHDSATKCEESHSKIPDLEIQYVVGESGKRFPTKMLLRDVKDSENMAIYVLDTTGAPDRFVSWREQELNL